MLPASMAQAQLPPIKAPGPAMRLCSNPGAPTSAPISNTTAATSQLITNSDTIDCITTTTLTSLVAPSEGRLNVGRQQQPQLVVAPPFRSTTTSLTSNNQSEASSSRGRMSSPPARYLNLVILSHQELIIISAPLITRSRAREKPLTSSTISSSSPSPQHRAAQMRLNHHEDRKSSRDRNPAVRLAVAWVKLAQVVLGIAISKA